MTVGRPKKSFNLCESEAFNGRKCRLQCSCCKSNKEIKERIRLVELIKNEMWNKAIETCAVACDRIYACEAAARIRELVR